MITTNTFLENLSIIETMGIPIAPNYYCPAPAIGSYPGGSTFAQCEAYCKPPFPCSQSYTDDCLEGIEDCYYVHAFSHCKLVSPMSYLCYCFYTLFSVYCTGSPNIEWDHTNDPLRTVLFDYNLFNFEDTFAEIWQCDDMNPVFMYAHKPDATRIRVKINAAYFLP